MGYYTDYSLSIYEGLGSIKDLKRDIEEQAGYQPFFDETKWYSHVDDMLVVSEKHPEIVIELKGQGEDSEDSWIKYFKNGKFQECQAKISYDDFDESKLK